jgi:hypothetical protein
MEVNESNSEAASFPQAEGQQGEWGPTETRPQLLEDSRHSRADAQLAVKLIGCGVLDEPATTKLLRAAGALAAKSASAGRVRDFKAAMSVLTAAANLGLQREALDQRAGRQPSRHLHLHQAPADERLAEISAKLGIPMPPPAAAMHDVYRSLGLVPPPPLD